MNHYRVELLRPARKELESLPGKVAPRIVSVLRSLRENPRPQGVIKLKGEEDLYRVRVGRYRIVYEIHDRERLVLVTRVRHRKQAYE